MSQPRRAKKIDRNQQGVVGYLRGLPGVSVALDHDDILIGYRNFNYWFELKSPDKVSKRTGKVLESALKPSQVRLRETWEGQYNIVTTVDEILEIIGFSESGPYLGGATDAQIREELKVCGEGE